MAKNYQIGSTPSLTDFPFKNYGGSAIGANLAVIVDTSNKLGGSNDGVGVALPASAGVPIVGVTLESIPAGGIGRVRCTGPIVVCKAEGSITAGTMVQASVTSSKVGWVKALTSAKAQVGMALDDAADGEDILVLFVPANNA